MSLYKMCQFFPKLYERSSWNIRVELDLCYCATQADLEGATGIDTLDLASKSDLVNLKAQIDKIDIDKLKTSPAHLSKLNNVVDNDFITKLCLMNWL